MSEIQRDKDQRRRTARTNGWKLPPRLDKDRFLRLLRARFRRSPTPLETLEKKGCNREIILAALQDIVVGESISGDKRQALLAFGFSEKQLRAGAKDAREVANLLRELDRHPFLSLQYGHENDVLQLADRLEHLAERLEKWPFPGHLYRMRYLAFKALKFYVRKQTGDAHYREIADLYSAAYEASGLGRRYFHLDVIRHRGENIEQTGIEYIVYLWQKFGPMNR